MKIASLTALLLLLVFVSCKKNEKGRKPIPTIAYNAISTNKIKSGSGDPVIVQFHFADGNGDLGNSPATGMYDIYTTDSRDTASYNYYFPYEMVMALPPGEPVEGTAQVTFVGDLFVLRPGHPDGDTVNFEVYIRDRAGNTSNHFTTPDIYIVP